FAFQAFGPGLKMGEDVFGNPFHPVSCPGGIFYRGPNGIVLLVLIFFHFIQLLVIFGFDVERNHFWLVINGHRGTVFHGLFYIVGVNGGAEYLLVIGIFAIYGSSGEAYKGGIGQGASYVLRKAAAMEPVLGAVGFICHYDKVGTFRKYR